MPTAISNTTPSLNLLHQLPRSPEAKIFALANLWEQAYRHAFKSTAPPRRFYSVKPWQSRHKVDRVRWQSFVKLNTFLITRNIPGAEFCAAVHEHAARVFKRRPDPNRVASPWFANLWQRWRERKANQGNHGQQGTHRIQAAVQIASANPQAELQATIQQAYYDCRQFGVEDAPTILWGPEVLWLFMVTEPHIRPAIQRMLKATENSTKWYLSIRAVQSNPQKCQQLLTIRNTITKTPAPILSTQG